MRNNNAIQSVHLRKQWQRRVKTWFNQPARHSRRRLNRIKKADCLSPRPIDRLYPAVACPTVKHNGKLRKGRGFTQGELLAAGISISYARKIGISVDRKRRDKSREKLEMNVQRLKSYMSRLVLKPAKTRRVLEDGTTYARSIKTLFPIVNQAELDEAPRAILPEEREAAVNRPVKSKKTRRAE